MLLANDFDIDLLESTLEREMSTIHAPHRENDVLASIILDHMRKAGLAVSQDAENGVILINGIYGSSGPVLKMILTPTHALYARYTTQPEQNADLIPQATTFDLIGCLMVDAKKMYIYPRRKTQTQQAYRA